MMTFGKTVRAAERAIKAIGLSLALVAAPAIAATAAQAPATEAADAAAATATDAAAAAPQTTLAAPAAPKIDPNDPKFKVAPGKYEPMKPTEGKGMPVPGGIMFQDQYSDTGKQALHMHQVFLLPVIIVISLLVLVLLLYVMARFNRRANPVPSKTAHNTMLEVAWTGIPILILVAISVPSVALINKQFEPAPEGAITIKATGNSGTGPTSTRITATSKSSRTCCLMKRQWPMANRRSWRSITGWSCRSANRSACRSPRPT